jgi:hypothetical protein
MQQFLKQRILTRMPQLAKLDDVIWHDGQILSLSTRFDPSLGCVLEIRLFLRKKADTQERSECLIVAKDPQRIFTNFDVNLMKENFNFGNIADAKIYRRKGESKLLIVLVEGYIEVTGQEIDLFQQ